MKIHDTKIIHHEMLCENFLFMKVKTNQGETDLGLPGQFYQIQIPSNDFQIRVPISIYDIEGDEISFLIKIVGEKTLKLKQMNIKDDLNIIGPLGNTFSYAPDESYMFISGGCGYAPLNFLYRFTKDNKITWIHGGRKKDEVKFAIDAKKAQIITTDDGSEGIKGFVTSEVSKELYIQRYNKVFACGPKPMLREVLSICKLFNKRVYFSLEAYMACGIGVCYGCSVKLQNNKGKYNYARVCKDGPVFNAYSIVWED